MFQSLSRDCLIIIQHIHLNVNTNFQKNLKNFEFTLLVHFGLFKVSDETAIYNKKDGHIQTARSILYTREMKYDVQKNQRASGGS